MTIHYLTAAEVYSINEEVMGERPIVRDRHLLRSAMLRPMTQAFGQEAYPTLMDKAAALLHSLAAHHLFIDGNKRTATRAVIRFLKENGHRITWAEADARAFVLEIAQGRHDIPVIATWLGDHTAPLE